jgi:osmotically inducible protein OsmC
MEMAQRRANAVWKGTLREGMGRVTFGEGSSAFEGEYGFVSRFEEGPGTNPEEMLGAAHAACFSMALASGLGRAGYEPSEIRTQATVTLEKIDGAQTIVSVLLKTEVEVPGVSSEEFMAQAEDAKKNCPVSRALTGVQVDLEAGLVG